VQPEGWEDKEFKNGGGGPGSRLCVKKRRAGRHLTRGGGGGESFVSLNFEGEEKEGLGKRTSVSGFPP